MFGLSLVKNEKIENKDDIVNNMVLCMVSQLNFNEFM